MRESNYRRWLAGRLSEPSIASYIAYCNRVERELAFDLDTIDLGDNALSILKIRLDTAGVAFKSVSNCMTAVRSYASMRLMETDQRPPHLPASPVHRPLSPAPIEKSHSVRAGAPK